MITILFIKFLLIIFLLLFSAFFSASETAFFSLTRFQVLKLKETEKRGKGVAHLLAHPDQLLTSILIGNESVNVAASALATSIAIAIYGENGKWVSIGLMTPVLLLFAEIIPKALAFTRATNFVLLAASPLKTFMHLVSPLRWFIKQIVSIVLRPFPKTGVKPNLLDEHFIYLVERGYKEGDIKTMERDFIANLLRFRKLKVSQVMTQRRDIFALSLDTPLSHLIPILKSRFFSRIPIYKKSLDEIVGILHINDLIGLSERGGKLSDLKRMIHPAYFVPLSKGAEDLFWEMQRQRIHMAIVVNEYGKVVGLITLEDLLEELFGEIYDEYDKLRCLG